MLSQKDALEWIMDGFKEVQFDTETGGRNAHICPLLCSQFGNDKENARIVVDNASIDPLYFKQVYEEKLLIGVNLKFDDQFLFKYGIVPKHQYDCMIVEQALHLGYDPAFFHCSLAAMGERYLGITIDKSIRGEIQYKGLVDDVIVYAAGDVEHLEKIKKKQMDSVRNLSMDRAIALENNFVATCAYLEWSGIRLDINKWKEKMCLNEKKKQEALDKLNAWVVEKSKEPRESTKTEVYLVKEDNHGFVETFDLPKGYEKVGQPIIQKSDYGSTLTYQKARIPDHWKNWVKVDLQGDLFSGFDSEPKCQLNWSSSKQLIPFFQYLGFNTTTKDKKTGEEKNSITEKVIKKQKGIADDFLKTYFDYKAAEKECSTYGDNYIDAINPITGRIHTKFKQLGCDSGRMSCGGGNRDHDTDLAKYKGISPTRCNFVQIQNLPADDITRSAFVSEPGNLFCSADFSALESRLGADIYQEPEMLDEFLHRSGDMHSLCAKLVFKDELADIPIEEIKEKRPDLRKKVKPIEFSQQFGGGAGAVADALGCSREEAAKFVKAYADGFKGVSQFKAWGSQFVRTHGYIIISQHTGLRLWWEDWKKWREIENLPERIRKLEFSKDELKEHNSAGAKWDRLALNVVTQGTGAEIIKLAATTFFNWVVDNGYFNKILLCDMVHDELCVEFPENLKNIVPERLKKSMEQAASALCKSLPIPSVPETNTFWVH